MIACIIREAIFAGWVAVFVGSWRMFVLVVAPIMIERCPFNFEDES